MIYRKYRHTARSRRARAALHIDQYGYAEIACPVRGRLVTTRLREGGYVRIDDGQNFPQLCVGLARVGNAVTYHSPEQLARDLGARLYWARPQFDRVAETIMAERV